MLDESEFLAPHGIRSLSRAHYDQPYRLELGGTTWSIDYEPAESRSGLFGGNSNWRGPIWFPINYLLVEALEVPRTTTATTSGSRRRQAPGERHSLTELADELSSRLSAVFLPGPDGRRPADGARRANGGTDWRNTSSSTSTSTATPGRGLGASHQTGWTALVATELDRLARRRVNMATTREGASRSPATET